MIFPINFEQKVGFDQIRQMLNDSCLSSLGKNYVEKIKFSNNFDLIKKLLAQVEEFRQILLFGKPFPAQDYFDLIPELNRLKVPGAFILQENLFDLKSSMEAIFEVGKYLKSLD
nr:endonuclease MutS2 [Bacteroidota bacterium]